MAAKSKRKPVRPQYAGAVLPYYRYNRIRDVVKTSGVPIGFIFNSFGKKDRDGYTFQVWVVYCASAVP